MRSAHGWNSAAIKGRPVEEGWLLKIDENKVAVNDASRLMDHEVFAWAMDFDDLSCAHVTLDATERGNEKVVAYQYRAEEKL